MDNEKELRKTLKTKFPKIKITRILENQIFPYANNNSLVIINSTMAVVANRRGYMGSVGGYAYWDQIHMFVDDQKQTKEWQWRDHYYASNDKPWLKIRKIGETNITKDQRKINFRIELINEENQSRYCSFSFEVKKPNKKKNYLLKNKLNFLKILRKKKR